MHALPEFVTGRVSLHPRGFGFLSFEHLGERHSAFIAPPDLNPFLADDLVRGRLVRASDGRLSVTQLSLEERPRTTVFGQIVNRRGRTWLEVDREVSNTDWPLQGKARSGQFAVCRLNDGHAELVRCLASEADLPLEKLLARFGLQEEFGAAARAQTEEVLTRPHEAGARQDLRGVPTVTIDSASTRDIDDAVSVLAADAEGAMRLLVSIADPAQFIPAGSPLDDEARARGTSTYLPDRVLPMLPEELSSGHLSLHPEQDRLTMTAELRLDAEGQVLAVDVYESVIRSAARLTYDELADWLDLGELSPELERVREILPWLRTAAARLSVARQRRGGVRVVGEEARLSLDEGGNVVGAVSASSSSAHLMVERFMVAANEAVARWLVDRGVPSIFRVHPEPTPQQVESLGESASRFGFEAGFGRRLSPAALAAFDSQIVGAAVEPALRSVMLGMLGKARYTVHPDLHFGLAAPLYLHFTSPLRRYADLAVHRAIKRYLHGERRWESEGPAVEALARRLNERAGAASKAEALRRRMILARHMEQHLGDDFPARITRILPFGLLAQLDGSAVDGLIPVEALGDGPWEADPRGVSMEGPGERFTVGTPVWVRVVAVDPDLGRIEYGLLE